MSDIPVAIVTGGAQGLGAAICNVLLKNGYKVCVSDIQEQKGQQFVEELQEKYGKQNVKFAKCDVSNEAEFKGVFDFTLKEFKRIDLVVNNAGILLEQNPRRTVDVNLMGTIAGCRLALQYMGKSNGGKGGTVINTSSILGFHPFFLMPVYVATKHAVIGLTRSYALPYHFDKDGVLFAAICPSYMETGMRNDSIKNTLQPGIDPFWGHEDDVLNPDFVAQGVMKLLEDRINGSALVVTKKEGYTYVGLPEEFKNINFE